VISLARSGRGPVLFATLVAVGLGAIVRVLPELPGPFTTGDGGLILAMVDDIRRAGLSLPQETSYNAMDVPFLYPPLALMAAAGLGELLGISSLSVIRIVPVVLSLITLAAFAWLASRLLEPKAAVGALLAFALMPGAYASVVAGGGVTRGMGLLFVILAMAVAASRSRRVGLSAAVLGLLLGLSVLAHPQAWLFGAAASAVFFYRDGSVRTTVVGLVAAALVALAVALPWMAALADRHGWGAFAAAGHRWEPGLDVVRFLGFGFSALGVADLFLVFGVVGLAIAVGRRQFRLPILVICLAVGFGTSYFAALTWSLLAGVGLAFIMDGIGPARTRSDRAFRLGMSAVALLITLIGTMGSAASERSPLQRVTSEQASALDWVAEHTHPNTRFIVATTVPWGVDEISEWFPAVTGRQSVGTVQGSEWLGRSRFSMQAQRHAAIRECAGSTDMCLTEWADDVGLEDAWVFIPKGQVNGPLSSVECCLALRETIRSGARYAVVYDGVGATIARPRMP